MAFMVNFVIVIMQFEPEQYVIFVSLQNKTCANKVDI